MYYRTPLGGLEPPAFRLTAERASQLRHKGIFIMMLRTFECVTCIPVLYSVNEGFHKQMFNQKLVKSLLYVSNIVCAWLAQSVEHETLNLRVVGSTPTLGVICLLLCFLVYYLTQLNRSTHFVKKRMQNVYICVTYYAIVCSHSVAVITSA